MTESKKLYLIAIRPPEYLALKMFCARSNQSIVAVATEAVHAYIANETHPNLRRVAADSDHIAQPNEQ